VLYNPQMQSLVVQTTVGLDSHPVVSIHERDRGKSDISDSEVQRLIYTSVTCVYSLSR
jgi:hypothetical protein